MRITLDLIERAKSPAGGWTRETIETLGVPWPLVTGWKHRVVGKEISESDYRRLVTPKPKPASREPEPLIEWES